MDAPTLALAMLSLILGGFALQAVMSLSHLQKAQGKYIRRISLMVALLSYLSQLTLGAQLRKFWHLCSPCLQHEATPEFAACFFNMGDALPVPVRAALWRQHSGRPHVLLHCLSPCLLLCSNLSLKHGATLLRYFIREGRSLLPWSSACSHHPMISSVQSPRAPRAALYLLVLSLRICTATSYTVVFPVGW